MQLDKPRSQAEIVINESLTSIQACLRDEDWPGVEAIVSRLPAIVESVPASDSAAVLVAVRSCLESVRVHVESQSDAIGSQLKSLKQGRIATRAYLASGQLPRDV